MIRAFTLDDLDAVMALWLETNRSAHHFIPSDYWEHSYAAVRSALPHATLFVYLQGMQIVGFIGLVEDTIAGIFVSEHTQSKGIGRALLAHAKDLHPTLSLMVYAENRRALAFYLREGFSIQSQQVDEQTAAVEYVMGWTHP